MEKKIKALAAELLNKLGVQPTAITVSQPNEAAYQLDLQLTQQETGILIGYHGDTIASLQLILNILFYKKFGQWAKLVVNVNDYREKRLESLTKLGQETAEKVKATGQPLALFNLNPFERRVIHELLAQDAGIATESEGEGPNRHLIVKPAEKS